MSRISDLAKKKAEKMKPPAPEPDKKPKSPLRKPKAVPKPPAKKKPIGRAETTKDLLKEIRHDRGTFRSRR